MLFPAVLMNIPDSKVCLKEESSIGLDSLVVAVTILQLACLKKASRTYAMESLKPDSIRR